MQQRRRALISLCLVLGIMIHISHVAAQSQAPRPPSRLNGLYALDINQRSHTLSTAQPTILVFLGQECAISQRFIPRLNALAQRARAQGFDFYGVFSDHWATRDKAITFQQEYNVDFPLLMDTGEVIASRLQPTAKPEAFVFDANGAVAYQGRIDNRFVALGRLRQHITQHDLLDAIHAVSQGKAPTVTRTKTIGCFYGRWDT